MVLAGDPDYERTRTGVRLLLAGEVRLLILTGGEPGPGDSATSLRDVAIRLGVPPERIRMEQVSRSTHESMVAVRPILEREGIRQPRRGDLALPPAAGGVGGAPDAAGHRDREPAGAIRPAGSPRAGGRIRGAGGSCWGSTRSSCTTWCGDGPEGGRGRPKVATHRPNLLSVISKLV